MTKIKRTNDRQSTTQKTKDLATQTPIDTVSERVCFRRVSTFRSTIDTCRANVNRHQHRLIWKSRWKSVCIRR